MNWRLLPACAELNRYFLIQFGFARVCDLNDNSRGAIVKGMNWKIELWDRDYRAWYAMLNKQSRPIVAFTAIDAWDEALTALPDVSGDLAILCEFMPKVELTLTTHTNGSEAFAVHAIDLIAWPSYRAVKADDNPALAAVHAILQLNHDRHNALATDMRNLTAASPRSR